MHLSEISLRLGHRRRLRSIRGRFSHLFTRNRLFEGQNSPIFQPQNEVTAPIFIVQLREIEPEMPPAALLALKVGGNLFPLIARTFAPSANAGELV